MENRNLCSIVEDEPQIREFIARAQADKINYENDERKKVADTSQYPHMAIARMSMWFLGHQGNYFGTGFLADQHVFITCAHNVRGDNNDPATSIHIRFGINGDADKTEMKTLKLEGKDFTVPESFKEGMDSSDIAWIDLKQYHQTMSDQGIGMNWAVNDLPSSWFWTKKIPDAHGTIKGNFSICGNT